MFGYERDVAMDRDMFEDEARSRPRTAPRTAHALGEPLDDLSLGDLDERIVLLRAEIERLEAAKRAKRAASVHAGSIFKP